MTGYVIVRSVYVRRLYKDPSGKDIFRIEVVQEWRDTYDGEAVQRAVGRISASIASSAPKPDSTRQRLREATCDYFADQAIQKTLGPWRATQRWATAPGPYLPADMADAITVFNDKLDGFLADELNRLVGNPEGIAGDATRIASGITANLVFQPISKPLLEGVKTLELIGLTIGLLTAQAPLIAVCAKNLVRQELTKLIGQSISETLERQKVKDLILALDAVLHPEPHGDDSAVSGSPQATDPPTRGPSPHG